MVPRRLALVLLLVAALAGCGSSDDDPGSAATTTSTSTTEAKGATKTQPTGTVDRGARRCTKAAFLGALLADVEPQAFKVDEVKCAGDFARSRFVNAGCAGGQGVACDGAKVATWRRGSKRWRLIAYADGVSCSEVRKKAGDFPQSLCD